MTAAAAAGRVAEESGSVLRNSTVMAAGSAVSRVTGFVRSAVVVAALGTGLLGDGYAVANTVPNVLYILLIGGALNAVLVPELVRAAKRHPDGGAAYTDRLLTACTAALVVITAAAVLLAPAVVSAYTDYTGAQASTTVALTRYCLPQILFYGLFTLLGQVLNARGRFAAMMWTPILNNLVVIGVFALYLAMAHDGAALTASQTRFLGWGTTAGIAVQAAALVPSLRAAGFRWRPRFDWRGSGLARPLRSAGWLVLLVLTNQLVYAVTTRLSTSTGLRAVEAGVPGGAGFTAYGNAHLVWAVPQGIVTVSLVTALMPRMSAAAADGDLARVRADVGSALRSTAKVIVPAAVLLFALAPWVMGSIFGYGRTGPADVRVMAGMLMALAPGLIAFSGQYVLTRGFYALSDTRTPCLLNLLTAALQTVLAITAYLVLPPRWAVTGIAAAGTVALFCGLAATARSLDRRLTPTGRAGTPRSRALRTHALLLAACAPAGLLAWAAAGAVERAGAGDVASAATGTLVMALLVAPLAAPRLLRRRVTS
ncbi:murein biosynthesis integral membrane protein MurJ [Streptomyces sp. NPDC059104]|uniref:murein biosynthesis integral membrane protein MurJ n=1 Tax=Streptomyces sp. NPDC059104 TaxID=3346729 RepID=UPI0036AAA766